MEPAEVFGITVALSASIVFGAIFAIRRARANRTWNPFRFLIGLALLLFSGLLVVAFVSRIAGVALSFATLLAGASFTLWYSRSLRSRAGSGTEEGRNRLGNILVLMTIGQVLGAAALVVLALTGTF